MKVIEYQLPDTPYEKGATKIIERLESAHRVFQNGEYEPTVSQCRQVLEELNKMIKDNHALSELIDYECRGEEKRDTKSTRIEQMSTTIQSKLWSIAQIGPHEAYHASKDEA